MKVAVDTNILVYAEGINGLQLREQARSVLDRIDAANIVLPVQVLAELYRVLLGKGGRTRSDAVAAVSDWASMHVPEGVSVERFYAGVVLAERHQLSIFDAVLLATAADAGCRILLSEDMRDGFSWAGCVICNPMTQDVSPLLAAAFRN